MKTIKEIITNFFERLTIIGIIVMLGIIPILVISNIMARGIMVLLK